MRADTSTKVWERGVRGCGGAGVRGCGKRTRLLGSAAGGNPPLEALSHLRPLTGEDAVEVCVARRAVPARLEMPKHAVLPRPERFESALRWQVEIVDSETYHLAAERVERVAKEQPLACRVHVRPL